MFKTTILNFSGIYDQESFYLQDKGSHFVALEGIPGTNCMCDDVAKDRLIGVIAQGCCQESPDSSEDDRGMRKLPYGLHFIDNGNYHYVSALYLSLVREPFSLVVLDHHPDMQRPMFDILSCGGWICDVLDNNPFVRDVHVIGADEKLIEELDAADRNRVRFYKLEEVFPKMRPDGEIFVELPDTNYPVYLSIDKDVISRDELVTNWDQGSATRQQVLEFVKALLDREMRTDDASSQSGKGAGSRGLIGVDICGECAPDQEDCDLRSAILQNDEFNASLLRNVLL